MSSIMDMTIWSRGHIARAFGIPPELIGLPTHTREVPDVEPDPDPDESGPAA